MFKGVCVTKIYETIVLVDSMIADESIESEFNSLESIINSEAKLIKRDIWGKRKLAYSINKRNYAHYGTFYYEGSGKLVDMIEKGLSINDNILRWMTIADNPAGIPQDKVEEAVKVSSADDVSSEKEISTETEEGEV